MTSEEIRLVLIDLCARLPYGIKVSVRDWDYPAVVQAVYSNLDILVKDMYCYSLLGECSIYLRPMSSMTEEEKTQYRKTQDKISIQWDDYGQCIGYVYANTIKTYDWLNANHFDYRGLIPMGLALEAPEGMYKTE